MADNTEPPQSPGEPPKRKRGRPRNDERHLWPVPTPKPKLQDAQNGTKQPAGGVWGARSGESMGEPPLAPTGSKPGPKMALNRFGDVVPFEDIYGGATLAAVENRTAKQLARQEKVFELSVVQGKTYAEIATELKIERHTVAADMRAEEALRVGELEDTRDSMLVRQLMLVQRGLNESYKDRNNKGTGAYGAHTELLKQRAKLLGLDAAVKVDLGFSMILDAINILPSEADQKATFEKIINPSSSYDLPPSLTTAIEASRMAQESEAQTLEGEVTRSESQTLQSLETELEHMPEMPTSEENLSTGIFSEKLAEAIAFEARAESDADAYRIEANAEADAIRAGIIEPLQTEGILVGEPLGVDPQAELRRSTKSGTQDVLEAKRLDGVAEATGAHNTTHTARNYTADQFSVNPETGKPLPKPKGSIDPITLTLQNRQRADITAQTERTTAELATQLEGSPNTARASRPPKDAAAETIASDWFALLTSAEQGATVKAIRAAAKARETSE